MLQNSDSHYRLNPEPLALSSPGPKPQAWHHQTLNPQTLTRHHGGLLRVALPHAEIGAEVPGVASSAR